LGLRLGPEGTSSRVPEVFLLFFLVFFLRLGTMGFFRKVSLVLGEKLVRMRRLVAPPPGGPGKPAALYAGGVWRRVLAASGKG
jgi:hypothetical protein